MTSCRWSLTRSAPAWTAVRIVTVIVFLSARGRCLRSVESSASRITYVAGLRAPRRSNVGGRARVDSR